MVAAFAFTDVYEPEANVSDASIQGQPPPSGRGLKLDGRAKALRLGEHGSKVATLALESSGGVSAAPACSPVRVRARSCSAAMLCELMALAQVSSVEVAAALDLSDRRVCEMRMGQRPIAVDHVFLMVERLPSVREVFVKLVVEMLGAK